MNNKAFPVIDQTATGRNIRRLRIEQGLTVRDLQDFFGFEEPQAIYKWQRGESLPSVDNLYALGSLLEVPIEQILIQKNVPLKINEQQEKACCSDRFCELLLCFPGRQRARQKSESFSHFAFFTDLTSSKRLPARREAQPLCRSTRTSGRRRTSRKGTRRA